jgi:hypothetical protein
LGDYIAYVGGPGAGQAAKVVNNLIMGVSVAGNCEATALGQRLGLDMKEFFEIAIRSSADNWSLRLWNPARNVVPEAPSSRGYAAGFKTWLLAKDLHLAIEADAEVGANLKTAEAAYKLMTKHSESGGKDMDATSLVLHLGRREEVNRYARRLKKATDCLAQSRAFSFPGELRTAHIQADSKGLSQAEETASLLSASTRSTVLLTRSSPAASVACTWVRHHLASHFP